MPWQTRTITALEKFKQHLPEHPASNIQILRKRRPILDEPEPWFGPSAWAKRLV